MELTSATSLHSLHIAELQVTLTREQRKAAYAKRWAPEPHAREVDLVLGEVDYDDVTDLEALWEKGTGWMLGWWRYSEADRDKLRKQRDEDARIRCELRRLNEDASYEPVSCVPLSNSAISFLGDQEAAGVVVSDAAPAAAARDVPSPAPKPLPPAPLEASSPPPAPSDPRASEAPLSVDGARRA